jgi:heat shock protein HslJ
MKLISFEKRDFYTILTHKINQIYELLHLNQVFFAERCIFAFRNVLYVFKQSFQKMKKVIFYCLFLVMIGASCRNSFEVEPSNFSVQQLLGTWKMTRYQDLTTQEDIGQPTDPHLGEMRIHFNADGTAGTKLNCNSGGCNYSLEGNRITLSPTLMTQIGCNPAWCDLFFKVFENPNNAPFVTVNGLTLTLISENQKRKVTMTKL